MAVIALVVGVGLLAVHPEARPSIEPADEEGRPAAPADASVSEKVMLLGDSIMRSTLAPTQSHLVDRPGGCAVTANAIGGMGVDDSPYLTDRIHAATLATGGFDAIVVSLGLNDVVDGFVTPDAGQHVEAILDATQGAPVLWLTLGEELRRRAAATAFNATLRAAQADHPNLHLIAWGRVVDAHPELLMGDGVHLTGRGQRALAAVITTALDQELGG